MKATRRHVAARLYKAGREHDRAQGAGLRLAVLAAAG
jgi:hypothetical protein